MRDTGKRVSRHPRAVPDAAAAGRRDHPVLLLHATRAAADQLDPGAGGDLLDDVTAVTIVVLIDQVEAKPTTSL